MKEKKNPIVIAIIVLAIALIAIIYFYINPVGNSNSNKSNSLASSDIAETKVTVQTIENTLSNSGQISSGLDEKLYLHASYYFEDILVDENIYVKEGTNIIKYTNGSYLTAPYDCVIVSSNLPRRK